MAVTNGWGQAAVNNTIDYGKGKTTATNDWGKIYDSSASGDTSLGTAAAFANTKSIALDGVDDFVQSDATYSKLDGQSKASFSMWLKPITGGTTLRTVFMVGTGSTGLNSQVALFLYEGVRINFNINSATFFGRADISGITYGSWNHLLITVDFDAAPEFKCYVNGVDATTNDNMSTLTSFPTATESLYLGEFSTGQYTPFLGGIDEFAIWSGVALTSTDVTSIYNSGVPNNLNDSNVVATAPTTWYRCGDGDTAPNVTDNGSGGSNATMTNFTTFSTDVPT